uniref:Rab-GAP TBC domain-containing protein n=2 Tax=Lactuca sativa TaxID=4236 RepID=A0A9R1V9K8_LACSA|nr:hypothetical protein LSAT_V11C500284010 [Lactuca sativa]KAJ0203845.1 hypothetical protein LSAT_V11C500284040 [Lactuca sativa]
MGSGHSMSNGAINPKVPKEFFLVHKESKRNTLAPDHESNPWAFYSISPEQAKRFTKIREREGLIENDVGDGNPNVCILHDILLTYSCYNFDLGYCQGLSDFSPLSLLIMKDESQAFWK